MDKKELKRLLIDLNKTTHGKALKIYLDEKFAEINDIMKTESWEETQGRKFALILLKDLFYFMEERETVASGKNIYT